MTTSNLPRGLRNNNPGNIRINSDKFQGEIIPSQDKSFKQFETIAYGYRAMFVILDNYRKKGFDTIEKIINRWAPPEDKNHTESYVKAVEMKTNISRDKVLTELSGQNYIRIVASMAEVENGVSANIADVIAGFNLQSRIK